ncbi:hypothetical protein MKX01_032623 [Papaver californicum]|nr:hypothetical protein MKX01_032623 [Papaver californicum]
MQGSANKEEEDKAKEVEETAVVSMAGKVFEDSQGSVKVVLGKVVDSKKVKRPNKVLKKSKKKVEQVQNSAATKYDVEAPELLKASNNDRRVMQDTQSEVVTFCPERDIESVAALPKVAKVVDKTQAGKPKKKASLSDLVEQEEGLKMKEESKKAEKPKKVLKKLKKKVEDVQGKCDEEEIGKSKEEEAIPTVPMVGKLLVDSQASVLKLKVASDKVEGLKNAKRPKKILKKLEKKVKEVQGNTAKKEDEDKPKEEEEIAVVSMILEDTHSSVLKRKIALDKEEESKKAKSPKKVLKKSSKKVEEVHNATIKYDVEAPALLQASNSGFMEDSQVEEVIFCPEKATKSVSSLPKVANVVGKSEVGEPKEKASLNDLVHQEEKLEIKEDSKKAKKPKKVLKKSKKKVEELHSSAARKEEEDKSMVEEQIVDVPMVEKLSKHSHTSMLKRKLVLDTVEEPKKAKRPMKLLKTSRKKVEGEQRRCAKKEEHDKSKEDEDIAVVPTVENVLKDSQATVLMKKVALDELEESKKAKKIKKVLKKPKKKVEKVQGSAAIKYDVEAPELLQASNRPVTEDSQNEEVTFCQERATESVAALSKVANVVDKSEVGEPKKNDSSNDLVHQEEKFEIEEELKKAKKPKKVLKKTKKKVEELQGSASRKEEEDKSMVEEQIVAVPMAGEVLEDTQVSGLMTKVASDEVEESTEAKRPKKVLKKVKKRVKDVQGSAANKEEKEVAAAPMIG